MNTLSDLLNPDHRSPERFAELPARERILLTAYRLFYRDGIRATGVDRLILESAVTKVTFYRYFPSKNDVILAFLDFRHERWMAWFIAALARHGGGVDALLPTLEEWFGSDSYRGCAFINSVAELGEVLPDVIRITRAHKQDMIAAIKALLPEFDHAQQDAEGIALLVDGAIIRAQYDASPQSALRALNNILKYLNEA